MIEDLQELTLEERVTIIEEVFANEIESYLERKHPELIEINRQVAELYNKISKLEELKASLM